MKTAATLLLVAAGGLAVAYWVEDPWIRRDSTLRRMLAACQLPDCKP